MLHKVPKMAFPFKYATFCIKNSVKREFEESRSDKHVHIQEPEPHIKDSA